MATVFDIDGAAGRFAMYEEPPTGPSDGPLTNPLAHLSRIKIHSNLDYLQVATEFDLLVNHPFVAKQTTAWNWSTFSFNWAPATFQIDRILGTHNLGYIPTVIVANSGGIVEPGAPVQVAGGSARYVQIYLNTAQVRCIETVDSSNTDLPALDIAYKVMVLRDPASLGNGVLFDAQTSRVTAGQGKFDSDYHYVRAVAAGESPYSLVGGQNIDAANGVCRMIDALGNVTHDFYVPGDYTGSLTGVISRQVQR